MKHVHCLLAAGLALGTATSLARADVSAAARAFSDGQAAQLDGNYERAAQSFELAYNIAASKEALRSAVRARQLANQLPRAATLAQLLLAQYNDDATSAKLANDIIAEARTKLGRISVTCTPQCTLALGGRATSLNAAPTHVVFVAPGRQLLEISFDGDQTVTREATLRAGDDIALTVAAPPARRAPGAEKPLPPAAERTTARHDSGGLSPYWAIGGGTVTLALVGLTTWSGLDTNAAHDAYAKAPSPQGWSDGRAKQLRTNILLGTTAAVGLVSTVVAVFWTRWDDDRRPPRELAVVPGNGGATLSFGGRF
jgi:hypothetical protein